MRRTRESIAAAAILLTAACGELATLPTAPDPMPDPSATFTRVQNEVFTPTCALSGCHGSAFPQSELVLAAGQSYAMLVGRPSVQLPSLQRVAPGATLDSYLYRKITGAGIVNERMPLGGPPLSDAQIALVRDWINRGAPND